MLGDIYLKNKVPPSVDRKYFWRVYDKLSKEVKFFIDGKDVKKANWMRYVLPAYTNSAQNLVAYQDGDQIFFLTIKPIKKDEELLVWYCKDFAERLKLPLSGEQMMRIMHHKEQQLKKIQAKELEALTRMAQNLPNEIWEKIFLHLSWYNLRNCKVVCNRWNEIITRIEDQVEQNWTNFWLSVGQTKKSWICGEARN